VSRRSIALLLVALAAAGLAGCGGDGRAPLSEHKAAVKNTIVTGSKQVDPAECKLLYTQEHLEERALGIDGEVAVRLCEEVAEKGWGFYPREVKVSNVRIGEGAATAEVSFVGGTNDGQVILYSLLLKEGRWKIHRLVEFIKYDRARLLDGLTRELHDLELQPRVADCMVGRMERLNDDELQDLALYDPSTRAIAEACFGAAEGAQTL